MDLWPTVINSPLIILLRRREMSDDVKITLTLVSGIVALATTLVLGFTVKDWVNSEYHNKMAAVELKQIELQIEKVKYETRKLLVK